MDEKQRYFIARRIISGMEQGQWYTRLSILKALGDVRQDEIDAALNWLADTGRVRCRQNFLIGSLRNRWWYEYRWEGANL